MTQGSTSTTTTTTTTHDTSSNGIYFLRGRTHLHEHFIQPLQGSFQTNLNPARSTCDRLTSIVGSPPLDETYPNHTHRFQLVNHFEAVRNAFGQQLREVLVVEYLQIAARRDFTHGRRVPAVPAVTVRRLHEDGTF